MTYKLEDTQFWGGNLGYAKPVVGAKTAIRTNKMMTTMLLSTPEEVEAWTQLERNRTPEEDEAFQDLTKAGRPAVDSDFIKPIQAV